VSVRPSKTALRGSTRCCRAGERGAAAGSRRSRAGRPRVGVTRRRRRGERRPARGPVSGRSSGGRTSEWDRGRSWGLTRRGYRPGVLPHSDGIELIVSRVCDIESRIRTTYVMKLDHSFVPGNTVNAVFFTGILS
jgi:hypothetical protein